MESTNARDDFGLEINRYTEKHPEKCGTLFLFYKNYINQASAL